MKNDPVKIPLEIQLEAICFPKLWQTYELLSSYSPELREWDPRRSSTEIFKFKVRGVLNFTTRELILYLENHPEKCEELLCDSYDKRYSPSTFIEEWKNKYRVGWSGSGDDRQLRVFPSFFEAAADYVLFSWGLPRLTKDQSDRHEADELAE
jgi:hypothetical protein